MGTFKDRKEAGVLLAERLKEFTSEKCTLYALPRGGVPVAFEVSLKLLMPLDVLIVKKIGSPGQEELALGAITEGDPPLVYWNLEVLSSLGLNASHMESYVESKKDEVRRISQIYRGKEEFALDFTRTAIIVDDGIATGATVKAAIRYFRAHNAEKVVVAVPVAAWDVAREISREADAFISVIEPRYMGSVGEFYDDFRELDHVEIRRMVLEARKFVREHA